eukprot:TRINITY_DN2247_c0_g1_i2.p1 TRINITY_DN2247_c0_g1~~TRINITY_DN2247_c0_g1_i2.p1  ORF type:complete len:138 (-),score=14.95 TRINITY_DN2247_c0_g1_i2:12-425(-)
MRNASSNSLSPYYVNRHMHETGFGAVTKYVQVSPKDFKAFDGSGDFYDLWDKTIEKHSLEFEGTSHNLFCNNCHNHVAAVLNELEFQKFRHWNTLSLILYMIFAGRYVSLGRFFSTNAAFVIIVVVISLVVFFTRSI